MSSIRRAQKSIPFWPKATLLLLLSGIVALVLLWVFQTATGYYISKVSSNPTAQTANGITAINPPRPLNDFTLTSHTGDNISLSDLRGKTVIMSFGYTYCPDVCPLTLTAYRRVYEGLGDSVGDVQFVFISVDPTRDTPNRLADYLNARNSEAYVMALTGSEGALRRLGADYGLYFQAQNPGESGYYAVDHTASVFIIDPQGRLSHIVGFDVTPATLGERLLSVLPSQATP